MPDWQSQAEIIKDGSEHLYIQLFALILISSSAAFSKFMHVLLGLYMYELYFFL